MCASFSAEASSQAGESCECGCVLAVSLSLLVSSRAVCGVCCLSLLSLRRSCLGSLSRRVDLLTCFRSRRTLTLTCTHTPAAHPSTCHSSAAAILLSPILRLTLRFTLLYSSFSIVLFSFAFPAPFPLLLSLASPTPLPVPSFSSLILSPFHSSIQLTSPPTSQTTRRFVLAPSVIPLRERTVEREPLRGPLRGCSRRP